MDDNKVINIIAQLVQILNDCDNIDRWPFEATVDIDGCSTNVSVLRIAKSDKHIPGISSKISQIESRLHKELSYSKLISLTHELSLEEKWIDKSSSSPSADKPCADDCLMPFSSLVEKVFESILKVSIFKLTLSNDIVQHYKCDINGGDNKIHQNLSKPLCLIDSLKNECFYSISLIREETSSFTLWDAAVFSYDFLINDSDKLLFILYQLLSALNYCGTFGYLPLDLRLQAIYVDTIYWVKLDLAYCLAQTGENLDDFSSETTESYSDVSPNNSSIHSPHRRRRRRLDRRPLWEWSRMWVSGQISNFDYLTTLNRFAGRRRNDPYYHPVFPWVVDFKQATGGYRDLSKTKYRLAKGDLQLDQTYCVSPDTSKSHVPHHVSEFLSDIGYFTYKARVTSKDTLCKHVRSKWVPEEYPSSVQRMYEWTPDECIPEFYSDTSIFKSIHNDLLDLEYPSWCSSVDDFIEWHRTMLESDAVSSKLHHWIDLVFGYKLSGIAAVEAKNVQYHLSNNQHELHNYGIVQLFDSPHPAKLSEIKPFQWQSLFSKNFDHQVLNPLYDFETLQKNSLVSTDIKPTDELNINEIWKKICKDQKLMKSQPLVQNCMKSLAIALIELCHPQTVFHLPRTSTLSERWILAEQTFRYKMSLFPRCLRSILKYLVGKAASESLNKDESTSPIESCLVTPGFLIQPVAQLIPFPFYASILHDCLCKINESEEQFLRLKNSCNLSLSANLEAMRSLKEVKVRLLAKTFPLVLPQMVSAGIDLVSRLVRRLLVDPWTSVVTAWTFFNPLAEALGPSATLKQLATPLIDLYDVETPCTAKHLKLYHRTFLLQILVRIGTKEFLDHFVLPLIEAVAGERDKLCLDEDAYSRHLAGYQATLRAKRKESRLKREDASSTDIKNSQYASGGVSSMKHTKSLDPLRPAFIDSSIPDVTTPMLTSSASEPIQFDLDISDDNAGAIHFGKSLADDAASMISSSSFSSQQNLQSEYEDDEPESTSTVTHASNISSISEVAQESLMWLAHRLGPLLTSKHVTRNLLRMLALCYHGDEEKLSPSAGAAIIDNDDESASSSPPSLFPCHVIGDASATRILTCLEHVASVYGEQFILRHYFAHCVDVVQLASKRLNPSVECGLIACVMVVRHMFPFLSNERLMDNLKDHYFVDNILYPLVRLVSSSSSLRLSFSSTRSRAVLAWKLVDCLYCLGVRVGGENVKSYLFVVFQRLMCTYNVLYELNDGGIVLGRTPENGNADDAAIGQLKEIFTPELASLCVTSFKQLVGRQYLQLSLPNSELMLKVSELHKIESIKKGLFSSGPAMDSAAIGAKVLSGNRLAGVDPTTSSPLLSRRTSDVYSRRLKNSVRQIKGNWLAYWEHELGRSDRDVNFNFKQMKLITFVGHTAQVRRFHVLENENSFISASQDKTVKLWSLRSFGDGSCRTACQLTYKSHSKPLWDLTFIESLRLVASTDGKVQIWDPFFGSVLREFDFGDFDQHLITVTKALAPSSKLVLAAGTSSTIKFLDVRQAKWAQEYKLGAHAFGPVRGVCIDPNGHWVACGHGIGQLTVLDLRTGHFLATRKIADVDISLMEYTQKGSILVSLPEQNLLVWKMPQCVYANKLTGSSDTLQCMTSYNNEILCCTQNNRLRIYSSSDPDVQAMCSESKLRSDIFTGTVSSMAVLPLNKLLLLGSSNGSIELLC